MFWPLLSMEVPRADYFPDEPDPIADVRADEPFVCSRCGRSRTSEHFAVAYPTCGGSWIVPPRSSINPPEDSE